MGRETTEVVIETTQTLDTMLHQILNQALVAIGAEAGSLMLVNNKRGILQIKARLGKPRPGRKTERVFKIGEKSIAGWVVQNKQSYLCPDVKNDPNFTRSRSGKNFSSVLSVPVVHEGKVLVVINADAAERNFFTEAHRERLESVARQVAAPIAERISVLDALAEVGVELSRLPREGGVEPVLEKIAQLAVRSLGADVVTLYQYIQEKDEFPVEGTGPAIAGGIKEPRPMRRKVYPGDVPWTVVKERKPDFYSDVYEQDFLTSQVERPGDTPRPRFVEREGIKSMAALLLPYRAAELKDEEVVGVMFANYRTRHEFNIDEVSALATFADYAAIAILNARREEQRRAEQLKMEEQQRRAEQMRMVESISANFAHRMSNLAGTSRVATQILRERIDPADELSHRQLARIERESKVLLELAERIARPFKETGRMFELTPIDIAKVLEEELQRIQPDFRRISITKDVDQSLPKVQSVEFQLRQVLHDIISNAIEAMADHESGTLTVRARFNRKTNRVEVEVSDTGTGIPDDIRDRLFAPGVTTKKEQLGIGLWWCRTFMRATGGDVFLKDTRLGEGSTFVVEVPCVGKGEVASVELVATGEVDVLVVDDDQEWRDSLVDIMETEQYSVETATNYAEASHALATKHFKLAVLDIRLVDADPENEDGLRLLAYIDKASLDTKVIIITAYGTEQHKQTAGQSPRFLDFIHKKEFDLPGFRALVRQAVKGIEPSPPSQVQK